MVDAPYTIQVAPYAAQQWSQLPMRLQRKLVKFLSALQVNPRPTGAEKIEGLTGLYAQEVDHMRIIYKILEQDIMVLIIK